MSDSFYPGDIVVVIDSSDSDFIGSIGVVKGEGNVWDYTVVFSAQHGEEYRFDPEQLVKIDLATLIGLASPVSPSHLALLRWRV